MRCAMLKVASVIFAAAAAAPASRRDHAAVAAGNSNALWVFGGEVPLGVGPRLMDDLWSYSIETGSWTLQDVGAGPSPRARHVAVHAEGVIWIHGGWGGSGRLDDLWSYNISVGHWKLMSSGDLAFFWLTLRTLTLFLFLYELQ